MARAFVLVKYPGELRAGFRRLEELGRDEDFLRRSRTIIEGAHYAFGSADFFVVLFAANWGHIAVAVQILAESLDRPEVGTSAQQREEQPGVGRTITSTILGLGDELVWAPDVTAAGALDRLIETARTHPQYTADQVALASLGREYVTDRLKMLSGLIRTLQAAGVMQEAPLRDTASQINGILASLTGNSA